MDDDVGDYCAVCAETIDFVAYGRCGHKQVCSNCVVRLRFICKDKKCCICKTESDVVFVTKALGDYTQQVTDFSALSSKGSYKYHEDSQAYFDDKYHFNEVMNMCNLSCIICEKSEVSASFRNPDKLREHMFEEHELLMCSFCIEGRKKFIHEQKLFTRDELKRHIHVGDSKSEDGFTGHPECNLCRKRFYGEPELDLHKHTQHFSCFLCQRRNPNEKIQYFNEYDDLETHFTRQHYLCRDKACLAKKFIAFPSEFELKRHVTKEHGGEICPAVPTGFRTQPRNNRKRTDQEDVRRADAELLPSNVPIIQPYDFPSLPNAPKRAQEQKPLQTMDGRNTMAGKLHGKSKFTSPNSGFPTLAASFVSQTSAGSSSSSQPATPVPAISKPASSPHTRSWLAPGKPTTWSLEPRKPTPHVGGRKPAGPTKEDLQNAGRSSALQQIRVCFDFDEVKLSAFEEMSSKYNTGAIDADAYLGYVERLGLSHLVFELVKLCSDSQKQRKLLERHNASLKGKKGGR